MILIKNFIRYGYKIAGKKTVFSFYSNDVSKIYFHKSAIPCIKMYADNENQFAYSIMEKSGYATILKLEDCKLSYNKENFDGFFSKDWHLETPQTLFQTFECLGKYCLENQMCISDSRFDKFIDTLTDNIKHATDEELQRIFYSLAKCPQIPSIRTRNFIEVWAALDDECLNRILQMNFDNMLSYLSLFYLLNVIRYSDFSFKCLQKLATKAKMLTSTQIVQTMFFIGIKRSSPHNIHNIEVYIENNFSRFLIDELAIISMGFFKSKTPIRSTTLVYKFIDQIIDSSEDVHEVSLAALLKIIRYSLKIPVSNKIHNLLECLQYEVPRLSIMCNVHIALVGTSTLTLHRSCLTKIAEATLNSLSSTRIKDLERLVLTFGTFNFVPNTKECFFSKVTEELSKENREEEIKKYGNSYACCISYLGLSGIYPIDLTKRILNKEFLDNTYGKHCLTYGREVLTCHNIAKIFYRDLDISSLSEKDAIQLAKKYTDYVPNENYKQQFNVAERMFIDVKKTVEDIQGGTEFVIGEHIVSHHQRGDIIICNDHEGKPMPVDTAFKNQQFGTIRYPPDENKWIVLIVVGRNSIIQNSDAPTGHFTTKARELTKLGFYPAIVVWTIYTKCETQKEKVEYLNKLISDVENKKQI